MRGRSRSTFSGAVCGIAGLLIASRLNSAQPALGQGYGRCDRGRRDRRHVAVGRRGSIVGTIIGAFIMSVLTNGLRIMSVAQEWQTVVTGVIIILAVYVDILRGAADGRIHAGRCFIAGSGRRPSRSSRLSRYEKGDAK